MSAASIQDAFDRRLLASQDDRIDIAWRGVLYTPVQGTPYLAPSMTARSSVAQGAGADGTRLHSGVYQINVNHAAGNGLADANAKADELIGLFPRGANLTTTDGQTIVIEIAEARPDIQQNAWLVVPVLVRWWSLEFPT